MISSGALPKLALRKPPTPGPVCSAACSVASPISHASGMSAAPASTNITVSPTCAKWLSAIVAGARASNAQRMRRATARVAYRPMLEAVLFDWGETLMHWAWEPDLLAAGHAAGLRALGREPRPALTERFREAYLPLSSRRGARGGRVPGLGAAAARRVGHRGRRRRGRALPRGGARGVGARATARRHDARAARVAARARPEARARLERVRSAGWLLHRDLEQLGIAERIDVARLLVGGRPPQAASGDLRAGARGARRRGRSARSSSATRSRPTSPAPPRSACTRARRSGSGPTTIRRRPEPEFQAFTQMDVLTVVKRLS